jgi:hypothetical protein
LEGFGLNASGAHPAQVNFKYVDDLASVWCEWAEMELRHKNFKRALDLMRRATYTPDKYNRREVRAKAAALNPSPACPAWLRPKHLCVAVFGPAKWR